MSYEPVTRFKGSILLTPSRVTPMLPKHDPVLQRILTTHPIRPALLREDNPSLMADFRRHQKLFSILDELGLEEDCDDFVFVDEEKKVRF